ncbi:MAG: histidinol phosphate phosphatase domain-containing protein [Desulfobacterales bacterium]
MMIDLHMHTVFSDGELIPSELVRRAQVLGVRKMAITDHGDASNMDWIIPRIVDVSAQLNRVLDIVVLPGIEITHVPPELIAATAKRARKLGAAIIVLHGETIVEPVAPGTNEAGLGADIDVLAHPGLITRSQVAAAKEKGILLEITARKGHSLTNGHVAKLAAEVGASLVINTDSHGPGDLIDETTARQIVCGAGLTEYDLVRMQQNAESLIEKRA